MVGGQIGRSSLICSTVGSLLLLLLLLLLQCVGLPA
eukprot:SAG31_NODE_36285_length_314_cov_2.134884_1_plen_35_part_10